MSTTVHCDFCGVGVRKTGRYIVSVSIFGGTAPDRHDACEGCARELERRMRQDSPMKEAP